MVPTSKYLMFVKFFTNVLVCQHYMGRNKLTCMSNLIICARVRVGVKVWEACSVRKSSRV